MDEKPIVDPAALARLQGLGGDKLAVQMIRLYLENAAERLRQIDAGLAAGGDPSQAAAGAHSLKSSAANVGAQQLRAIAADMERAASGGDTAAVAALLPSLESAFSQAITALESVERGLSS